MSEDVKSTPEGASQETGAAAETPAIPDEFKWLLKAKPEELVHAFTTLQEKSSTRLEDVQAKEAELARLRAEKQQAEDAKLAEQQKWEELANKRAEELKAKDAELRSAALDRLVIEHAAKLKFHDWQEAKKLADLSGVDISTTDGGASAVQDALKTLADKSPHLIQSEQANRTQTGAGVMNPAGKVQLTAADLNKMTPDEIRRLDPNVLNEALKQLS